MIIAVDLTMPSLGWLYSPIEGWRLLGLGTDI